MVPLCCPFHPKLFSKATCLPAQLSQTWACHTPAALAMPPVQFSALAVTKSPEVTSSNQRHGHKGKRDEYFLASSSLWHTQHLLYLPGWAGGSMLTPHSVLQPIQPCSLSLSISLFTSLPGALPFPFHNITFFFFSMSTTNPFWCCLCPSDNTVLDHSSIGFNPLLKSPSFALLWRTESLLNIPFLGSLTLLPVWG